MPIIDLATKKMVGVKKGSYTYYHELGHIEFSQTNQGILYDYCQGAYLKTLVILIMFNTFFHNFWIQIFDLALGCSIIYFYVYEELWCWGYSLKNKPKLRSKK